MLDKGNAFRVTGQGENRLVGYTLGGWALGGGDDGHSVRGGNFPMGRGRREGDRGPSTAHDRPIGRSCSAQDDRAVVIYWCWVLAVWGAGWAASLPMASPERISSTRRFCWRPSGVSLVAMGSVLP